MISNRRRCRRLRALAAAAVGSASIEMSKADQVVSCGNDATWMDNESGESPCTVAYYLMLRCADDPDFKVLPLNGSTRSYANPLVGQCTCNTVVYNLMSACAICQGGFPSDFTTWTNGCSDVTHGYPDEGIAQSFKAPHWAYLTIVNHGGFSTRDTEEAAGENKSWDAMQIVLPIIIGVIIAIIAGVIFYFYRRRLKQRYTPVMDPYSSRTTHVYQDARTYHSQQSIPQTSRSGHHHAGSSSSLGVQSVTGRNSPAPKRKNAATVAWEQAHMQAPRRFGGLLPDRPKVHERTRSDDWNIDSEPEDEVDGHNDTRHFRQGSATSFGLHSKEASGDSQVRKEGNASHSNRSRTTTAHGRSESRLGLLSDTSPDREGSVPGFVRGIANGISAFGSKLRLGRRPRPVAVVPRTSRRRLNLDGEDSASSPTVLNNARESRLESFVFVGREPDLEAEAGLNPVSSSVGLEDRGLILNQIPSQGGSSGSGSRSDGSGDSGPNSGEDRRTSREREVSRGSVVLISRSPGQDFNSNASPISPDGLGPFSTSTESNGHWAPALTDSGSSVLHPACMRQQQVALPLPPAPPPSSQTYSRTSSPSHSRPGTPRAPSRLQIPQGNGSSHLLVPPAVRAAGGFTTAQQQAAPSGLLPPESITSSISPPLLPSTCLFSGSVSESLIPEPPSAVSNVTTGTTAVGDGATPLSEQSSSHAYTVPNPFVFEGWRGGSARAANELRMASPPRSRASPEIID